MSETATERLRQVFEVDKQLRGLRSRLNQAERFLGAQSQQLASLTQKKEAADRQLRQLQAKAGEHEGEAARLEEKVNTLREQMNLAKTAREYKAFLTEVNTFKADKDKAESSALEYLQQIDELKGELAALEEAIAERSKMCHVAEGERTEREGEIAGRLKELEADRDRLRGLAPADALRDYDKRIARHPDEDPMAPIEEQDRRRHEYTCGSCMMELPVEAMSAVLSKGTVNFCPSCGVILFLPKELADALRPANSRSS
ncbi:MAG: hypothetical protein EA378_12225 [Phycisphaerales bacterium]|nr:MAG: hypothetical protein EA378_12225 [Phycisphaerales bacterium]